MTQMIDSKEIEKIVLEHLLRVRQLEDETCKVLRVRVENLIARLLLKVNQNLKTIESIKSYDCLYYRAEELKEGYELFLKELDAHPGLISDDKVKEIFAGLRKMTVAFLEEMPSKTDNPITYERMVLISAAILRLKQFWIESLETAFSGGGCSIGNDVSKEHLMNFMTKEVRGFFFDGMFTASQLLDENLRIMSDFEEGKKYEMSLQAQGKQLSILGMMQKDVVLAQAASQEEASFLRALIDHLGTCHKLVVSALEKRHHNRGKDVQVNDLINMDLVDEMLDAYIFNDAEKIGHLFRMASEINDESLQDFRRIIETEVDNRNQEISDKVNREAMGYQLLSDQLVGVFSETAKQLEDLEVSCVTETGVAIAQGILGTMSLKLEAIREKDESYHSGRATLSKELDGLIMDQRKVFVDASPEILQDVLNGSDRSLKRKIKVFEDSVASILTKHFRYDMAYMKNDLLFELRTFEELIEHSLKKLIELEHDGAAPLTAVMVSAMERSRDILFAHAIELIIPKAHDKFDAKAHEVLMAESVEGFAKGEIIRSVNVGYRLKDHVIIRASVIAAK